MAHPIDAVFVDGAAPAKATVRAHHKASIPLVVDAVTDIQGIDLGGARVVYVLGNSSVYRYDAGNVTGVDDGADTLVDPTGRRYLRALKPVTIPATEVRAVSTPGGRLSLSATLSVDPANLSSVINLYYVPHSSGHVPIYDGTKWTDTPIGTGLTAVLSDATKNPAACVASSVYDWFVWNDAGTLRLTHGAPWSSPTARPTGASTSEIERQDGVWVNKFAITNGPAAKRATWVGTTRTDGTVTIHDAKAKRGVWNAHNRVRRPLFKAYNASTWTYATATIRQANADADHQIETVCGMSQDAIDLVLKCGVQNNTVTTRLCFIGIGLNSTTALVGAGSGRGGVTSDAALALIAKHNAELPVGFNTWTMLEQANGTDTQTFNGTNNNASGFWGTADF